MILTCTYVASLLSITHNANLFPEPNRFNPERFINAGIFVTDVRVCPFSVGLRNCIGKQLALDQYFIFATQIISKFRIIKSCGSLTPEKTTLILTPKPMKLHFIQR